MIRVVRIAGESFDLENQEQLPKALILSNGKREFPLYVDDDTAKAVLEMMRESVLERPRKVEVPSPEKPVIPNKPKPEPAVVHQFPPKKPASNKAPPMASVVDAPEPEEEEFEDAGAEPGEEYNDPATGAESL